MVNFTVHKLNSKVCLNWNLPPLFGPRDIMNILLTWLFQRILLVLEPHFMAEMFCTWALNPNWKMSITCYMLIISLTYLQEIVLMSLSDHWTGEQVMKTESRTLSIWTKVSLVMLFFFSQKYFSRRNKLFTLNLSLYPPLLIVHLISNYWYLFINILSTDQHSNEWLHVSYCF